MKTRLVWLLSVGVLLPSVSFAQDDFSGLWRPSVMTLSSQAWASPFAAAARPVLITQTADAISWQAADGRQEAIRLNESFVLAGRTYSARWVDRALLLEARWTLPDGRAMTMLQVLQRTADDKLELVSIPLFRSSEETGISRLVYFRRK